jgi:hypothetical protein
VGGGPHSAVRRVDLFQLREPNRKECAMKLASTMIERTLDQFEAEPLPENHPAVPQLNQLFGDHTFFLDDNGLNIVEPVGAETWQVVKLASWKDETRSSLTPHEPEPTDVVIALRRNGADDAA